MPAGDENAVAVIKPPNGVTKYEWQVIVECAVVNFRRTAGLGPVTKEVLKAVDIDGKVSDRAWTQCFDFPHNLEVLKTVLAVRGVLPLGQGLTPEQNLAIEILADPLQGSMTTRMKKANISKSTLDKWMLHKPFAEQLNMYAMNRMNSAKGLIDTALTSAAIDGSLDAMKYYDKRTGRDPDKKSELDGRMVIQVVLDALMKHLSDQPDVMRAIAAEIEVRTALNGDVH